MIYRSYLSVFIILPLLVLAAGESLLRLGTLNRTTQMKTKLSRRNTPTLPQPYLHLPVFVDSRLPLVEKEHFSPARGTGQEPLPEHVREILIPVQGTSTSSPSVSEADSVKTSCKLGKMHVQVQRSMLGSGEPYTQLRLGSCRASNSTEDHLYFDYDLGLCGTKRTVSFNTSVKQNGTNCTDLITP